ncbi:MAG: hypothetical protein ABI613_11465, partial [Gemmatimonadota bacterium]
MSRMVMGMVLLVVAFLMLVASAGIKSGGTPRPSTSLLRAVSMGFMVLAGALLVSSMVRVIDAGEVGVKHAFGTVTPSALLPGIRFVEPWSNVEI